MNSINLIGNICNDIEMRQTSTGKSVVQVNLAVKRPYAKDITDFIPCVVWNQQAEFLGKYAHKGSKIAVTGKLTSRQYEDKQGNKRTAYEVVCDTVELLDSKREQAQNEAAQPTFASAPMETPNFQELDNDDDLPF